MTITTAAISVELFVCEGPRQLQRLTLTLPANATLTDALAALPQGVVAPDAPVGVWGERQPGTHRLRDGDRVEVYRPLTADPKDARRRRFSAQKAQRPHAKSGRPLR